MLDFMLSLWFFHSPRCFNTSSRLLCYICHSLWQQNATAGPHLFVCCFMNQKLYPSQAESIEATILEIPTYHNSFIQFSIPNSFEVRIVLCRKLYECQRMKVRPYFATIFEMIHKIKNISTEVRCSYAYSQNYVQQAL